MTSEATRHWDETTGAPPSSLTETFSKRVPHSALRLGGVGIFLRSFTQCAYPGATSTEWDEYPGFRSENV